MAIIKKGCPCGKEHINPVRKIIKGAGAVNRLPEAMELLEVKKAFVVSDENTYVAAANTVCSVLEKCGYSYVNFTFKSASPKPDEHYFGSAVMHFDRSCDVIIGVGSGVINDISKLLASVSSRPYIIVATAPSMDGYASSLSSMDMDGLKVSLPSKCADVIIGDTDIMKNAPINMLKSGLGDMLAKYVSICEWRISAIINGEYYCENVAQEVRSALKKCTDNAAGLLERRSEAVEAVFDGLVTAGVAMTYAGISRPASGVEHYFSHVWDMRGLEFGTPTDFHGIQCAVATQIAMGIYEKIKTITPDREKAMEHARNFELQKHFAMLRSFIGKGAEAMIALEAKEQKYDILRHEKRLDRIIERWQDILTVMNEELPQASEFDALIKMIDFPRGYLEKQNTDGFISKCFCATKDIRDKYVLSRLVWDLGIEDKLIGITD